MAETTLDQLEGKKRLSRREALKIFGISGAAVVVPEVARWGVEQLVNNQDKIANIALAAEIHAGEFRMEKIGKLRTLAQLRDSLEGSLEALSGISEAQIMVQDGDKRTSLRFGTAPENIFPASVIKVPICYEAWKKGQELGKTFLTAELADEILHKSYTFKDLVMQLPIAKGKTPEQLEQIVREMLGKAGIVPKNRPGDLPLRVGMSDFFDYLSRMKLPEVMKNAMLQTQEDHGSNYGVSQVLLDAIGDSVPAFFKIGLIYDPERKPKELVNSYYFQLGDSLKALGYAKGTEVDDVHASMLHTAARLGSYSVNS